MRRCIKRVPEVAATENRVVALNFTDVSPLGTPPAATSIEAVATDSCEDEPPMETDPQAERRKTARPTEIRKPFVLLTSIVERGPISFIGGQYRKWGDKSEGRCRR